MAGTIRVLHVEDNDFFAKIAAKELEAVYDGLTVERADCASEALDRLESESFDCVISDYEMPGMDGLAFLAEVRKSCPNLPFILLTGGGSEAVASKAITSDVTDYFRKLAGVEQFASLAKRIENVISRRRAEEEIASQVKMNDLVWDLSHTLLEASTREEIEAAVCNGLSDSSLYRFAWIGELHPTGQRFVPRAVPDAAEGLGDIEMADSNLAEIDRVLDANEVVVTSSEGPVPGGNSKGDHGDRLVGAIVPIVFESQAYGAIHVYADRTSAFGDTERQTLAKFGTSVAYAIDSVQTRHELRRREQCLQVLNRVLRHNLRNDMTVILGYAENLIDRLTPTNSGMEAETIKRKAIEVTEISARASEVAETLEQVDRARKPIEITRLIDTKIEEYTENFASAIITWEAPEEVWVDADHTVTSALDEIVDNAVVHNDHESPVVHVTVSHQEQEGSESVRIAVEDNGPRIPAGEREVLIEGRETALHHSSGLGLWLVNWIVGKFNGKITFDDRTPRGNVVTIELRPAKPIEINSAERAEVR